MVAPVSTIENTAISNSETTIEDTHSIEINTQNLPTHIQQELDLFTSWASTFRGCTNNILGLIHSDISPKQAGDFFHAVSIARKQAGGIIDKTTIH